MEKKKKNNRIIIGVIVVIIGIVIAFLCFPRESEEERKERAIREAEDNLRKSRQERIEAEKKYIDAVDEAERTERILQEVQK